MPRIDSLRFLIVPSFTCFSGRRRRRPARTSDSPSTEGKFQLIAGRGRGREGGGGMDRPAAAAEGGSCVRREGSTRSRMGKTADSGTHLLRLGKPAGQRGAQLSPAGPRLALGCVSMRLLRPASRHRGRSLHGLPACCRAKAGRRITHLATSRRQDVGGNRILKGLALSFPSECLALRQFSVAFCWTVTKVYDAIIRKLLGAA